LVSRRRLFGLLGSAAAVGTGLAVAGSTLTADPASAIDGSNLVVGATNNNNDPGGETALEGSTSVANSSMFFVLQNNPTSTVTGTMAIQGNTSGIQSSGVGVAGLVNAGGGGFGVFGENDESSPSGSNGAGVKGRATQRNGIGVIADSVQNAGLVILDEALPMPPSSGTWLTGSFVMSGGKLWFCPVGGTFGSGSPPPVPPQFIKMSPLVPVNPPARVLDSRIGVGPLGNGQTRAVSVTGTFGASIIPSGISAVLCNLTAAGPTGAGFLAMFEHGTTWSGTSNLNYNPGQNVSNNVTSAVSIDPNPNGPGQVAVLNGGPATDFVIDVFGYYP